MNLIMMFLLSVFEPRHKEIDYASVFATKHDRWAGGASICLWREVRASDHIIAHRTLPCGTVVFIYNPRTGLSTTAIVGDHGPYGACLDYNWEKGEYCRRWTLKKRESDPGEWRGAFDLTPSVAQSIGQSGFEIIEVTTIEMIPNEIFLQKVLDRHHNSVRVKSFDSAKRKKRN